MIWFAERGFIGSQRPGDFFLFVFFVGMTFQKKTNQPYDICYLLKSIFAPPPSPKSTLSSPIVTVKEGMEIMKQTKTKIGVGSVVKTKVGELEKINREGRIRRMSK